MTVLWGLRSWMALKVFHAGGTCIPMCCPITEYDSVTVPKGGMTLDGAGFLT